MGRIHVLSKSDFKRKYLVTYSPTTYTQSLVLNKGWNLISFYVNFELNYLLSDVDVLEVKNVTYSYNSEVPFFSTLNSSTFSIESGYWLRSSVAKTINLTGVGVSAINIPIVSGWNLISFPFSVDTSLSVILNESYGYQILEIKTLNLSYNSQVPFFATLNTLKGGQGYWLRASSNFNFVLNIEESPEPEPESEPEPITYRYVRLQSTYTGSNGWMEQNVDPSNAWSDGISTQDYTGEKAQEIEWTQITFINNDNEYVGSAQHGLIGNPEKNPNTLYSINIYPKASDLSLMRANALVDGTFIWGIY